MDGDVFQTKLVGITVGGPVYRRNVEPNKEWSTN